MKPNDTTESRRQAVIDAAIAFVDWVPGDGHAPINALESAVIELRHGRDAIAIEQAETAKPALLADGLWNTVWQTPLCYAHLRGRWYSVYEDGSIRERIPLYLNSLVPNTWPIPEAAKAKLRELGLKLDSDEQAEMQSTLSRPDRFDGE